MRFSKMILEFLFLGIFLHFQNWTRSQIFFVLWSFSDIFYFFLSTEISIMRSVEEEFFEPRPWWKICAGCFLMFCTCFCVCFCSFMYSMPPNNHYDISTRILNWNRKLYSLFLALCSFFLLPYAGGNISSLPLI